MVTYVPSAVLYRKYKRYSIFKGKVLIVDGTKIDSIVLETPQTDRAVAKMDAEAEIERIKKENKK